MIGTDWLSVGTSTCTSAAECKSVDAGGVGVGLLILKHSGWLGSGVQTTKCRVHYEVPTTHATIWGDVTPHPTSDGIARYVAADWDSGTIKHALSNVFLPRKLVPIWSAGSFSDEGSFESGIITLANPGLYIPAMTFIPHSPPGVYEVTTTTTCSGLNGLPGGAGDVTGYRITHTQTTVPATISITAPATVDFGTIRAGGGETRQKLPLEITVDGDAAVQMSLSAPAHEKYVGSLGSYGYKVYSDPTWAYGPTGLLSVQGDWYDMAMKKGTTTYTLLLGLSPTSLPFAAGTHSSNLTVNVRVI